MTPAGGSGFSPDDPGELAQLVRAVRDTADRLAAVLTPHLTGRSTAEQDMPPGFTEMLWSV